MHYALLMIARETQSDGFFDKFAELSSKHISRAWFFAACTASVVLWAITGPIFAFNDTWQLVINTATTIITFLLVALIQNTQERSNKAMTHKIDVLMEAIAVIMEQDPNHNDEYVEELKTMAGVEMEASA